MNLRGPYHWRISGAAELASVEQGALILILLIMFCSEKYLYLITRRKTCEHHLHFYLSYTNIVSLGYHYINVSDVSVLLIRAG